MTKIDGKEVLTSESAILRSGSAEVQFDTAIGSVDIQFIDADVTLPSVTTKLVDGGVILLVSDGSVALPYVYDGTLNVDGKPAFELSVYVSPMGDGPRARFVSLTIQRVAA